MTDEPEKDWDDDFVHSAVVYDSDGNPVYIGRDVPVDHPVFQTDDGEVAGYATGENYTPPE